MTEHKRKYTAPADLPPDSSIEYQIMRLADGVHALVDAVVELANREPATIQVVAETTEAPPEKKKAPAKKSSKKTAKPTEEEPTDDAPLDLDGFRNTVQGLVRKELSGDVIPVKNLMKAEFRVEGLRDIPADRRAEFLEKLNVLISETTGG